MSCTLRKFVPEDEDDLYRIMEQMAGTARPTSREKIRGMIKWNMAHKDDLFWAVQSEGRLIGYLGYTPKPYAARFVPKYNKKNSVFREIYIDEDFRRKGCGTAAFMESLKMLPPRIENIYVSIYEDNKPNIAFVTKMGFRFVTEFVFEERKSLIFRLTL